MSFVVHAHRFVIDLFEVTVLIGSCFLVNYVTADAKTNWAEGTVMIAFYLMIVRLQNSLLSLLSDTEI